MATILHTALLSYSKLPQGKFIHRDRPRYNIITLCRKPEFVTCKNVDVLNGPCHCDSCIMGCLLKYTYANRNCKWKTKQLWLRPTIDFFTVAFFMLTVFFSLYDYPSAKPQRTTCLVLFWERSRRICGFVFHLSIEKDGQLLMTVPQFIFSWWCGRQ